MIFDCLSWWYGRGWIWQLSAARKKLAKQAEYYSLGTLLGTLFAPYRQISAEVGGRGLSEKFQAWLDRLVSRIIGALVRLFIIIAGSLLLFLYGLGQLVLFALWPVVPLLPIVGVVVAIIGVGR